jgi:UDP-N-acetylglucosamine:LPS N-acetylglucosamine transferase
MVPRRTPDRPRVLLVGSSGGHLAQLMGLRSWWGDLERAWVTFNSEDAVGHLVGEQVTWAYTPTTRNIPNLVRNTFLAVRVLRSFRPDVVVSTGAGVALPFFVLGRMTGVRTVYIEVFDRVDSATLTGKLCRPFTDLMAVQWPEQAGIYRGSVVVGPLL